jgi:saccharopine dehydrogenase-like NADP-dependent oxidoreductase
MIYGAGTDFMKINPTLEKDFGVPILQVDYANQDSLVQVLESHDIDTVISCISSFAGSHSTEVNLIEAAGRSSVTYRYIPSIWSGFDYASE